MTHHDAATLRSTLAAIGRLRVAYRATQSDHTSGTQGIDAAIRHLCRESGITGPRPLEAT